MSSGDQKRSMGIARHMEAEKSHIRLRVKNII